MIGSDSQDTLQGGSENDSLEGRGGDDRLFGNEGEDILKAGQGDDIVHGDRADIYTNDVNSLSETDLNNIIDSDEDGSKDFIYGDEGNDILSGEVVTRETEEECCGMPQKGKGKRTNQFGGPVENLRHHKGK